MRQFLCIRLEDSDKLSAKWTQGKIISSLQTDSHNCCTSVIMNTFAFFKEISTKDLSTYAYIFKNYSKKIILHNAAKSVAQCTICHMVGCKSPCSCKEKWILTLVKVVHVDHIFYV